jgi:hypothetical protein
MTRPLGLVGGAEVEEAEVGEDEMVGVAAEGAAERGTRAEKHIKRQKNKDILYLYSEPSS